MPRQIWTWERSRLLNRVLHAMLGLHGRVLGGLGNAHYSELGFHHGAWRLLSHNVGH